MIPTASARAGAELIICQLYQMQVLQLPLFDAYSNLTSRDPKKVSFPVGVTK